MVAVRSVPLLHPVAKDFGVLMNVEMEVASASIWVLVGGFPLVANKVTLAISAAAVNMFVHHAGFGEVRD